MIRLSWDGVMGEKGGEGGERGGGRVLHCHAWKSFGFGLWRFLVSRVVFGRLDGWVVLG